MCGKVVFVRVIGLLADAPARAECAYTVPHNAKNGCAKCMVKGVNVVASNERRGRTTFPDVNATRRTDTSFRNRTQAAHHKMERSILEKLPGFDMVKSIPTEPMHLFGNYFFFSNLLEDKLVLTLLLDIGGMKKALLWMTSVSNSKAKQPRAKVIYIYLLFCIL